MEEIDGDAPAQRLLRESRRTPVLLSNSFSLLCQVVMKQSEAFIKESIRGADADTSRASGEAYDGRWKCLPLSPFPIGWVFYKITQPVR